MRLRPLLFAAILFFPALPVGAADTCCLCQNAGNTEGTCLTAPPRDVTLEGCGGDWAEAQGLDEWDWDCNIGVLTENRCKPVAQGGICQAGPTPVLEWKAGRSTEGEAIAPIGQSTPNRPPVIIPNLNTPIPGFAFTGAGNVTGETSSLLAQYLAAIYRYGISITAIASTIMFVYGAFLYLIGSAITTVNTGKTIMQEAVLGMLLVFSAVMILRTVNPDTLSLDALNVTFIKTEKILYNIPADAYTALTGKQPPSRQEMLALGKEMAAKTDIPEMPCIIYASMSHESGGKLDVIGHDENHQATTHGNISSRRAFLKSGVTALQKQFSPITCEGSNECFSSGQQNDDQLAVLQPPDYGLDWRFSHGIGASQITIQPGDVPCDGREDKGRGARRGGKCYTLPELLTPEGNISAMIAHFTVCSKKVNGDVAGTFACYGGRTETNAIPTQARMKTYENCRKQDGF